jgi:hypothetical protein
MRTSLLLRTRSVRESSIRRKRLVEGNFYRIRLVAESLVDVAVRRKTPSLLGGKCKRALVENLTELRQPSVSNGLFCCLPRSFRFRLFDVPAFALD